MRFRRLPFSRPLRSCPHPQSGGLYSRCGGNPPHCPHENEDGAGYGLQASTTPGVLRHAAPMHDKRVSHATVCLDSPAGQYLFRSSGASYSVAELFFCFYSPATMGLR